MKKKLARREMTELDRRVAGSIDAAAQFRLQEHIEALARKNGEYALPHEEVRKLMDEALGEKTLSQELYKQRNN